MQKILKNAIRCNRCGEVLVSEHVYDFKWCSCGAVAVDGGKAYLRRSYRYSRDDFTELSEVEESDPSADT